MAICDIDVSNKLMFCKDRKTSCNFQEEKDLAPNFSGTNGFKYSYFYHILLMNEIVNLIL